MTFIQRTNVINLENRLTAHVLRK